MGQGDSSPSAIRAAARAHFAEALPVLAAIVHDPEATDRSKIDAARALGDFGMGRADQGAVHVHAEGGAMLGVVMLPALGSGRSVEEAAASRADADAGPRSVQAGEAKLLSANEIEG